MTLNMHYVKYYAEMVGRTIGWYYALGFAAVSVIAVVALQSAWQAERKLNDRQAKLVQQSKAMLLSQKTPQLGGQHEQEEKRLYKDNLLSFLDKLNNIAIQHRILISKADFSTRYEADNQIVRYGISFPFVATYPDLREFLEHLEAFRNVTVEKISLDRNTVKQDVVSGQVGVSYLAYVN